MEDVVKIDFAKCLGYGPHPFSLPQHIVDFYDRFAKASKQILSSPRPDRIRDHVVIAVLADIHKDFHDRLAALENAMPAVALRPTSGISEQKAAEQEHMPSMVEKPLDGRSREARLARQQPQTVGA